MQRILLAALLAATVLGCGRTPAPDPAARQISVTMKKYSILPAEIRVKQGEAVMLEVSTADVQHGFDVPELGIKEPVQKGKPARIRLDTSRKGEFRVECGILCGSGHDEMTARIIVE